MKVLLALVCLAFPAWAVDEERLKDVLSVQGEQKQEMYLRYQNELRRAPDAAARQEVTERYEELIEPKRTLNPNVPLKTQLKQREAELKAWETTLDYYKEADSSDISVTSLTDEAAFDKGVESFRQEKDNTLDAVMDAQRERLKNTKVR